MVLVKEELEDSPWEVDRLEEFLYFCCPQCDAKCQIRDDFLKHALNVHHEVSCSLVAIPSTYFDFYEKIESLIKIQASLLFIKEILHSRRLLHKIFIFDGLEYF